MRFESGAVHRDARCHTVAGGFGFYPKLDPQSGYIDGEAEGCDYHLNLGLQLGYIVLDRVCGDAVRHVTRRIAEAEGFFHQKPDQKKK